MDLLPMPSAASDRPGSALAEATSSSARGVVLPDPPLPGLAVTATTRAVPQALERTP